jgi:hypothetical protein
VPVGSHGHAPVPQRRHQGARLPGHVDHDLVGAAADLVEATGGGDRAPGQDDDPVAHPLDLLEEVGGQHHVDAELGADAPDERQHLVPLDGVEPVGRLVEEQERRVVGEGGGQLDPLALPGRHRAHRPEPLLAQPHVPERVAGPGHRLPVGEAVHLGQVPDEVVGPDVGGEGVVLGRVADPLAHLAAGGGRVEPEHLQRAGVGSVQAEHQPDEGRLAGAVGAEEPGDPPAHGELGAGERGRRAPPLHQARGLDDLSHVGRR